MADSIAIVSYHDSFDGPYLDEFYNFHDDLNPSMADLDIDFSTPLQSCVDGFLDDIIDPFDDPILWDFCIDPPLNDSQSGTYDEMGCDQISSTRNEEGLVQFNGDLVQDSILPVSVVVPVMCNCCQVLREIIHTNGNHSMKLEIHGKLGMICHAILDDHFGENGVPSGQNYQMFDFSKNSIEDVKQFLMQYCENRKQSGYILIQDPLSIYYEAVCVGLDWNEYFITDDCDCQFTPLSEEYQMNKTDVKEKAERMHKTSLAEQRQRTGKLELSDLANYFHLPIEEAAKNLNVCLTVVKKICRKYGLNRWPHRKIKSLERQIATLRDGLNTPDLGEKARVEGEIGRIQQEIVRLCGGIRR